MRWKGTIENSTPLESRPLWVSDFRCNSLCRLQPDLPQTKLPWRRLIMLITVSTWLIWRLVLASKRSYISRR